MQTTVKVNGQVISREAIQFELERLVRFYAEHGMSQEEIREQLPDLVKKATDQAIGAKLLMDEAARLDLQVTDEDLDGEVAKIVDQVGGEDAFSAVAAAEHIREGVPRTASAVGAWTSHRATRCGYRRSTDAEVDLF